MNKKQNTIALITSQGILPLYYHPDAAVSLDVLKALYAAGTRVVEYTNRGDHALQNFETMRQFRDHALPGLLLGAGTIKNAEQARLFVEAGADFIVSPGVTTDVADLLSPLDILWIPGCMTATEIITAEKHGATFIKLFPGNLLGPAFVQAVKEIFPALSFMPTGGVEADVDNLSGWFKAGVSAVGMGSRLISGALLEQRDYQSIQTNTSQALQLIRDVKNTL